jgi:hypothetical protein
MDLPDHQSKPSRKIPAGFFSNIAAGTEAQITVLLETLSQCLVAKLRAFDARRTSARRLSGPFATFSPVARTAGVL